MDLIELNGYNLRNLDRKNILLGKNGCGKSRALRICEQALRGKPNIGSLRYLSPERSGQLVYEANIEQTMSTNQTWLDDTRRMNQASQFRQQSAAQYRRLELIVLREIEKKREVRADFEITFDKTISRINKLLDRVRLVRADNVFAIFERTSGNPVAPKDVSSGESELISLGIECLVFEKECRAGKDNMLLIDSPDVHLHPDLQARLAAFIDELSGAGPLSIIIATHSTALLGALSMDQHTRVAFMKYGDTDLTFVTPTDAQKRVLPIFGAHPLSSVYSQSPALLVEGGDDERIWQQVVRSSKGKIQLHPCAVDGVAELKQFEQEVERLLSAIYDDGVGYSLRDRDTDPCEIEDIGRLKRFRLNCRAAENLLVTDEVLSQCSIAWVDLETRILAWLDRSEAHPHYIAMKAFADSGFDRLNANLKDVRNDLAGIMGSNKPWEVIVGQAIVALIDNLPSISPYSLRKFLSARVCEHLLGITVTEDKTIKLL